MKYPRMNPSRRHWLKAAGLVTTAVADGPSLILSTP